MRSAVRGESIVEAEDAPVSPSQEHERAAADWPHAGKGTLSEQAHREVLALRSGQRPAMDRLVALVADSRSRREGWAEACLSYVAGSERTLVVPPRDALKLLRSAERYFNAASKLEIGWHVRIEAALQMRAAGFSELAVRAASPREGATSDALGAELTAVSALCLLDLGQWQQAQTICQRFDGLRTPGHTRADLLGRVRCLYAWSQCEVVRHLLSLGLDCHLTEMILSSQGRHATTGRDEGSWVAVQALDSLLRMEPTDRWTDELALIDLAHVLRHGGPSRTLDGSHHIATSLLLGSATQSAQTWLWLGLTQLASGRDSPAAACFRRAAELAAVRGQARVQRMALRDLALAHERCGRHLESVASWKLLRSIEQLLRGAACEQEQPSVSAGSDLWQPEGVPPVVSRHLRRALDLLAGDQVFQSVSELAAVSGVSRRTLEKVFRSELAQSVAECLRARRLARVRGRLLQTRDPIKRIALESGYPSASAMCHDFKRAVGTSPARFRVESRQQTAR